MATTAAELIAKGEHLLQQQLIKDNISIPLHRVTPEQIEESLNNLLSSDSNSLTNVDKAGIVAVLFNSPQWKSLDKFVEILKFDDLKKEKNEGVGALLYQINKRYAERIAYQTDLKLGNSTASRKSYDDIKNENRVDLFPDEEIKSRLNSLFMNKPEYSTKSSPSAEVQQPKLHDEEKTELTETNTKTNDKKLLQKEINKIQVKPISIFNILINGINSLIGKTPGKTLEITTDSTVKIYHNMGVSSSAEERKLNKSKNTEFDLETEIEKTRKALSELLSNKTHQSSSHKRELIEQINDLINARNYQIHDPREKAKITSILSAIDNTITQQMKQSSHHKNTLEEVRNHIPHDAKPLSLHSVTENQKPSPHLENKMNRQRSR